MTLTGNIHQLRCWPRYFRAIEAGEMTFQIRKLDRDYQVGDLLELEEWEKAQGNSAQDGWLSGKKLTVQITYIMRGDPHNPIAHGYAVMGIIKA